MGCQSFYGKCRNRQETSKLSTTIKDSAEKGSHQMGLSPCQTKKSTTIIVWF
jgi:hypothetical protein